MKKTIFFLGLAATIGLMSRPSLAVESASVELGQKLFNNPGLGASKNAISCNTCHPDGEGLHNAGKNPDLATMIKKCIAGPLKGEPIEEDTVAMESLKMYIKSLGN